jgi:hypothetical protein
MGFKGKAAIYLPAEARWDYLANLPQGSKVGEALRRAMNLIEDSVEDGEGKKVLAGALPKEYLGFEPALLAELVKIFNRPSLAKASGDVFGRIYEYFLNQFAQTGAQEGGEFFTPPSLVRMIVNIIEPDHGIVYDPACGSAGMFVQTGYFIERTLHASANERVSFWGQEKSDTKYEARPHEPGRAWTRRPHHPGQHLRGGPAPCPGSLRFRHGQSALQRGHGRREEGAGAGRSHPAPAFRPAGHHDKGQEGRQRNRFQRQQPLGPVLLQRPQRDWSRGFRHGVQRLGRRQQGP